MVASMTETMGTIPIMNTDMDGSSVSISGSQTHSQTAFLSFISQEKNILINCPQVLLVLVSEHAWPTRLRGTRLASTGLKIWECWRCVDVVEIDYDGSAVSFDDTLLRNSAVHRSKAE